ncbi:hypothetical protein EOK75_17200 (plasmid) [Pseudorhodobacter turbinis]|uniref:Uncharacterized protein n=1 Tax=Pseudorhodobacter turbinis TaxID=2500533 RepID=A0A4P8EJT3_9RHOB|nr:hypothetical protein [Pseudorhodobacter turbinis]QCO57450.1 hypothetical protein EOK75_17200 [Pseudorhodobacter turbinis]
MTLASKLRASGGTKAKSNFTGECAAFTFRDDGENAPISVYKMDPINGFGTKFADPLTTPGYSALGGNAMFSPDQTMVGASLSARGAFVYDWGPTGFGALLHDGTQPSGSQYGTSHGYGFKFSPNNDAFLIARNLGSRVSSFPISAAHVVGAPHDTSSTNLTSTCRAVCFDPSGQAVIIRLNESPWIRAFEWNPVTGFGAAYPDPLIPPEASGSNVQMMSLPEGDVVVYTGFGDATFEKVGAYKWSLAGGWGTKYTSLYPDTNQSARGLAVSKHGIVLYATAVGDYMYGAPFDYATGFGTPYGAASSRMYGGTNCVAINADANMIVATTNKEPYIAVYQFDRDTGYGTRLAEPVAPLEPRISAAVYDCDFGYY